MSISSSCLNMRGEKNEKLNLVKVSELSVHEERERERDTNGLNYKKLVWS